METSCRRARVEDADADVVRLTSWLLAAKSGSRHRERERGAPKLPSVSPDRLRVKELQKDDRSDGETFNRDGW
jgi:hypothetical protein